MDDARVSGNLQEPGPRGHEQGCVERCGRYRTEKPQDTT